MPPVTSHASKKRKACYATQLNVAATKAAQVMNVLIPNEFCNSSAWENGPKVFKPASARKELLSALFDTSTFRKIVKKLEKHDPLEFGRDLNAARYMDGKRDTPNAQVADSKTVWGLYRDGCTLQVHQPQRFQKHLAGVCSGLEQRLGCLVGINAYLTPSGTQGLAPHHDDVDIFVCQTEGSKRWRLYNPRKGFALPAHPSGDLPEDTLGDPVMDVTLQVGDVLYMPRGTVHQAVAQQDASTHLTISTYQNHSVGTLAQAMLHSAMQGQEEPVCLPLSLRRGLPPGFLYSHGYQADKMRDLKRRPAEPATPPKGDDALGQSLAQQVAAGLRELADKVEAQPDLISKAADLMSLDFMDSRAPPSEASLVAMGSEPTLKDAVICRAATAFRLVPFEAPDADPRVPLVKVISCLGNSIENHMMGEQHEHEQQHQHSDACCHGGSHNELHTALNGKSSNVSQATELESDQESGSDENEEEEDEEEDEGQADLVFPATYSLALVQLLSAESAAVGVKEIKLDGDETKLDLAVTLWKEGIVAVQPQPSKKPGKKSKN
ncbi:hypothetical protein WJX77_009828 [Trebouxia sp. C0004]